MLKHQLTIDYLVGLYLPYLTKSTAKWRVDWRCRSRISISFSLGQYAWSSQRWGPSIGWCCHSIAILASLFRACPRPCPPVYLFAGSHDSWHAQKMTVFSSLPFQTATFWYLRYESLPRSWCVLSSLFATCASGSTFPKPIETYFHCYYFYRYWWLRGNRLPQWRDLSGWYRWIYMSMQPWLHWHLLRNRQVLDIKLKQSKLVARIKITSKTSHKLRCLIKSDQTVGNRTSCLDGIAEFTCQCSPGYTGLYCETGIHIYLLDKQQKWT